MEAYQKIPDDKREKIFEVTVREFADKGYERASTNQIVQEANISKGLLFHYFGNKKGLFLSTFHYCVTRVASASVPPKEELSADIFERLLQIGRMKWRLLQNHSLEYRFLLTAYAPVPEEVAIEIRQWQDKTWKTYQQLLWEGIDFSRFRQDMPRERVKELLAFCLEAVTDKWRQRLLAEPDLGMSMIEHMLAEIEDLFEIWKHGLYQAPKA
ncbi:TetR/AcrR family transcriptional regulator [Laceyella tengchongensis]